MRSRRTRRSTSSRRSYRRRNSRRSRRSNRRINSRSNRRRNPKTNRRSNRLRRSRKPYRRRNFKGGSNSWDSAEVTFGKNKWVLDGMEGDHLKWSCIGENGPETGVFYGPVPTKDTTQTNRVLEELGEQQEEATARQLVALKETIKKIKINESEASVYFFRECLIEDNIEGSHKKKILRYYYTPSNPSEPYDKRSRGRASVAGHKGETVLQGYSKCADCLWFNKFPPAADDLL